MRPIAKKVAFTHCEARIRRTWLLLRGNGPSSNVSTTSWSRSGRDSGYCMLPMRGCSRGSTTRVRDVPSAFGWPGHSAAELEWAARHVSSPRHPAAHSLRRPGEALAIMAHRLVLDCGRDHHIGALATA